ncbi:DUF222 domain-containing protein [Microbacterium sp. STN6]|uniref:HNH endonuclease signature motif containing protein n=1 Tax=Microbacterium sp. STN6 TaxID=2995588 RepID=UPI002260ADC7|nr:HNH endonuclease signature motif containing protein [Microbacterium sp. STN6]MCX7522668.1 DUF222 domain-containing protein [Microbacterium sp. STN6]
MNESDERDRGELIAQAAGAISMLFGDKGFTGFSDDDVVTLTQAAEDLGRRLDAARTGLAAEVDNRSLPALGPNGLSARYGCRTAVDFLTRLTGVSRREVVKRVRLGDLICAHRDLVSTTPSRFPAVAQSFWRGELGVESAEAITHGLAPIQLRAEAEHYAAAERALVSCATGQVTDETANLPGAGLRFPADQVRQQVQVWCARLDPDGAAPESSVMEPRSRIGFGRLKDGVYPLRGAVTPDLRGIMDGVFGAYISARAGTSFPSEEEQRTAEQSSGERGADGQDGAGHSAGQREQSSQSDPSADGTADADERSPRHLDMRSSDEKRADVLRGVFDLAARAPETPSHGGGAPTVMVHVNASDLDAGVGVGWVDGHADAVSLRTVRQMICRGGYQPVVIGDGGEVLHLGVTQRCFSKRQRRAIEARDGAHCLIPGCGAPAQWTEVHHVVPWFAGGKTDVDNGVLLCWRCHHDIEESGWKIRMVEGVPQIKAPPWLDRAQKWRRASTHPANMPVSRRRRAA